MLADPISVFVTLLPPDFEYSYRRLMICSWHTKKTSTIYQMQKRELCLHSDWDLESVLRTNWDDNVSKGEDFSSDDKFYTDGLLFYRIVLNSILYLSSDHAETAQKLSPKQELLKQSEQISSRPKRKKATFAASLHSELDFIDVGVSIASMRDIASSGDDKGDERLEKIAGQKLLKRLMVRGHWRNQPYGPGQALRRLKWIMPYYKGPDIGELINKPYIVR